MLETASVSLPMFALNEKLPSSSLLQPFDVFFILIEAYGTPLFVDMSRVLPYILTLVVVLCANRVMVGSMAAAIIIRYIKHHSTS